MVVCRDKRNTLSGVFMCLVIDGASSSDLTGTPPIGLMVVVVGMRMEKGDEKARRGLGFLLWGVLLRLGVPS